MNLLRRTGVFEKLYQRIEKYSPLISTVRQVTTSPDVKDYLQHRFLDYLNGSDVSSKHKNTEDSKLCLQDLKLLDINNNTSTVLHHNHSLNYNSLVTSLQYFLNNRTFKCKRTLSQVDLHCCKLLGRLSKSEILHLLHLFVKVTNITETKFYKSALLALQKHLENDDLELREILQFLCFTSICKKHSRVKVKALIQYLPPLKDLALMDRCIVAHSTFMCSVKLNAFDGLTLEETLDRNASTLIKDPAILVTLCKAVRYRRPSSNFSLMNLSTEILKEKKRFTAMAAAHILSLYAEANHQNVRVMNKLFDDSMWQLMKERTCSKPEMRTRIKDVDRLLWAASRLNYNLRESDKMELSSFINRTYIEFIKKPFSITNTLLSLWILDFKLIDIIEKCLATGIFQIRSKEAYLWKSVGRVQLLLSCIRIEYPEIVLPDELSNSYNIGLKICESIVTLHKVVDELGSALNIESVEIDCPVSGIYIAGVSLRSKTTLIHIDVLDATTCFVGTNTLTGLARLKVRLLPKIGYCSILINADQLSNREFILSSIRQSIEDKKCG